MKVNSHQAGQMIIEPLLAIAIFGLLLAPFLGSISNLVHSQVKYRHQTEAVQYAREGLEIAYNEAVNADIWEDFVDSRAGTTTTDPTEGRFTRKITIAKANRDGNGNLDETVDNPDDNTLKAVSKVTWEEQGQSQEVELTTYLIDLEVF